MSSIFSNLPNYIIMRIIKEATDSDLYDYYQREKPAEHQVKMNKITNYLDEKSGVVNLSVQYEDPNSRTLLPSWAIGQEELHKKSKIWIQPFSSHLLKCSMGNSYWRNLQNKMDQIMIE